MSDEIRVEIKAAAKAFCHYSSGPHAANSCCSGIGRCEMEAAIAEITRLRAARIAKLEAAVATIHAERNQLIGVLQIAVEQNGDTEHPPAWVDAACRLLNRGFLKVDRAALEGKKDE